MISRLRPAAFRLRQAQERGLYVGGEWAAWAAFAVASAVYVWAHAVHPARPLSSDPIHGWWHWTDQGRYLRAALAWASGDLDPARHWYLPGYALLGAAFAWLTPAQPFYWPDLACLVAFAWLFTRLAARLAPGPAWGGNLGAAVFLATTAFSPRGLEAWVVPWTTTPTAVLTLCCLIQAMRFADDPRPRNAFLVGLAGGGVALFRPTDALAVLLVLAPFGAWVLLRDRSGWRGATTGAAAAGAGVLLPLLVVFALHYAVNGMTRGRYLTESADTGFEWSLLPLRWVTLFVSPQPLFPSGQGLAQAFPWIVPGVAGMAACLTLPDWRLRPRHVLVIGTATVHCAFYLAYRDLHPQGLFTYSNYHYFKWVLPLFGLYAALFAVHLATSHRRLRLAGIGLLAVAALFCWRAEWSPSPGRAGDVVVTGPHAFAVRGGFHSAFDAVLLAVAGTFDEVYSGNHRLDVDGREGHVNNDLKAFPVPGGLLFAPLRGYPARDTVVTLDPALRIDPGVPGVIGTQHAVFGLPCWSPRWISRCEPADYLPAPAMGLGQAVAFGGAEAPYLLDGWSFAEPERRWTDGRIAELRFRPVEPAGNAGLALELRANAYVPGERYPVQVTAYANGERIADWDFREAGVRTVQARIPARAIDGTGSVRLRLVVDGVRRPKDYGVSTDGRELGLFVRSLKLIGAGSGS